MKRIFALLLACLVLAGTRPAAFAQEDPARDDEPPGWLRIKTKEEPQSDDKIPDGSGSAPEEEPAQPAEEESGFEIVVSFTGDMMLASYKNETTASNFSAYANKNAPAYFLQNVKKMTPVRTARFERADRKAVGHVHMVEYQAELSL